MRKTICLSLAFLLLFVLFACADTAELDAGKISEKLASALTGQKETSASSKPVLTESTTGVSTTSTSMAQPTTTGATTSSQGQVNEDDWFELLAGWWVDMDEYDEPDEYPGLLYFNRDGYVFVRPDDLTAYEDHGLEPDFHYNWTVEDGLPYFIDYPEFAGEDPLPCELEIDEDGSMFIMRPNGSFHYLEAASSAWASRILLASPYYYLAEDVQLGLIRLGSNPEASDGVVTAFIDDKIMVSRSDTELIDFYGLHDAEFNDDYEIVDDDERYYPHMLILENDFTIFKLLDDSDGYFFEAKTASYAEFMQLLGPHSDEGLLFLYCLAPQTQHVSVIREIYLP